MASPTNTAKQLLLEIPQFIQLYTDGTADRLFSSPYAPPSPGEPTGGVFSKDVAISPSIPGRLYLPKPTHGGSYRKLPILVYYHGGGFCLESAFGLLHHRYINILSAEAGTLVISVEYRQAPEHPLPAAYQDSWEALNWVAYHVLSKSDPWITQHGDFTRVFVGGDSAGANIAHNMALRAGSNPLTGDVKLVGALLSHPFFWGSKPVGSEPTEDREKGLETRLWLTIYPSAPGGIDCPMINPMADGAPSLSGLGCSRIMICVWEKDILRCRGLEYVKSVKKSGWKGKVELVDVEGEDHCFHGYDPKTEKAKGLIKQMAEFIAK